MKKFSLLVCAISLFFIAPEESLSLGEVGLDERRETCPEDRLVSVSGGIAEFLDISFQLELEENVVFWRQRENLFKPIQDAEIQLIQQVGEEGNYRFELAEILSGSRTEFDGSIELEACLKEAVPAEEEFTVYLQFLWTHHLFEVRFYNQMFGLSNSKPITSRSKDIVLSSPIRIGDDENEDTDRAVWIVYQQLLRHMERLEDWERKGYLPNNATVESILGELVYVDVGENLACPETSCYSDLGGETGYITVNYLKSHFINPKVLAHELGHHFHNFFTDKVKTEDTHEDCPQEEEFAFSEGFAEAFAGFLLFEPNYIQDNASPLLNLEGNDPIYEYVVNRCEELEGDFLPGQEHENLVVTLLWDLYDTIESELFLSKDFELASSHAYLENVSLSLQTIFEVAFADDDVNDLEHFLAELELLPRGGIEGEFTLDEHIVFLASRVDLRPEEERPGFQEEVYDWIEQPYQLSVETSGAFWDFENFRKSYSDMDTEVMITVDRSMSSVPDSLFFKPVLESVGSELHVGLLVTSSDYIAEAETYDVALVAYDSFGYRRGEEAIVQLTVLPPKTGIFFNSPERVDWGSYEWSCVNYEYILKGQGVVDGAYLDPEYYDVHVELHLENGAIRHTVELTGDNFKGNGFFEKNVEQLRGLESKRNFIYSKIFEKGASEPLYTSRWEPFRFDCQLESVTEVKRGSSF